MLRFNSLIIAVLIVASCQSGSKSKAEEWKIDEVTIQGDQLKIQLSDGSVKDFDLKGGSEFLVSPDSQKVAVNTAVMSDLTVTEVISLNQKQHTVMPVNLSTVVWDSLEHSKNLDKETVLRPRTNAVKWLEGSKKLEIHVSGGNEMGEDFEDKMVLEVE